MSRIVMLLSVALLLSACVPVVNVSPLPTPTRPVVRSVTPTATPKQGTGLVVGQIVGQPGAWQGRQLVAYAAPFKPTTEGNGFFILEPSIHPQGIVNADGSFQIRDVPADSYVIVIGPTPEDAVAVKDGAQPKVITVKPDETVDLGKVDLR